MRSDLKPIPMTINSMNEEEYLRDDAEALGWFSPLLYHIRLLSSSKTTLESSEK
jgi:hypothetical protein